MVHMVIDSCRRSPVLAVGIVEQVLPYPKLPRQGWLAGGKLTVQVWQVALLSTIVVVAHKAEVSVTRVINVR